MMHQGMGYGGMRGHQQPQPQRQRRGNNRGYRNSRFDNQRSNQRSNKEIKTEPTPMEAKNEAPIQQNKPQTQQQPQTQPKPQVQPQPQKQQQQPLKQEQKPQHPQVQQNSETQPPTVGNVGQQNVQKPAIIQKPADTKNLNNLQNNQQTNYQKNVANTNTANNQHGNQLQNNTTMNLKQNSSFKGSMMNLGLGNRGGGRKYQNQDKMGGGPGNREDHFMMAKLKDISGSTIDLQPLDQLEQKFSGRNRLYIGNLTNDVSEEEIQDLFKPYGETAEIFINKDKNFAFIRIDYKVNAEKAKRDVDGRMRRGKPLRVRFAPHNAAIRIKNLTPFVSNELLYKAFEIFGKIERAVVKVDERGKSLGEGIVEFMRKAGALAAIRHCSEKCYFITSSLRPVVVESYEEADEGDGYTEKTLPRKNQDYMRAREIGPRFAEMGSFEHEYGTRWKQLYELYKKKEDALRFELHMEEEKLEAQMEYAKYEHETELLRDQLRQREQDRERQKRTWEMAERQANEQCEKERESLLRQQEDMAQRMRLQEDELRRRQQENTLFMQAQQLNRILDEQEQGMGSGRYDSPMQDVKRNNYDNLMSNMDAPYTEHYDQMQMHGHMGYDDGMSRWDNRQEDYPNKRRRY